MDNLSSNLHLCIRLNQTRQEGNAKEARGISQQGVSRMWAHSLGTMSQNACPSHERRGEAEKDGFHEVLI